MLHDNTAYGQLLVQTTASWWLSAWVYLPPSGVREVRLELYRQNVELPLFVFSFPADELGGGWQFLKAQLGAGLTAAGPVDWSAVNRLVFAVELAEATPSASVIFDRVVLTRRDPGACVDNELWCPAEFTAAYCLGGAVALVECEMPDRCELGACLDQGDLDGYEPPFEYEEDWEWVEPFLYVEGGSRVFTAPGYITLRAVDDLSGVEQARWQWDNPAGPGVGTPFNDRELVRVDDRTPGPGLHRIYLWGRDRAGNEGTYWDWVEVAFGE